MSKKVWPFAVGASALGVLATGIMVAGQPGPAQAAPKARSVTLVLYSRSSTSTTVDNAPVGRSPGDTAVISAPLYKRPTGGGPVGFFQLHRTFTSSDASQTRTLDQVTETFAQGQIVSGGSNAFAGAPGQPLVSASATQAVLGGTGRYRLARGELRSTLIGGNTIKFTHRLVLSP